MSSINDRHKSDQSITESEGKNRNYNLIKADAEALLGLVNKYVRVELIKDTEFFGFVHSIDPIQHSIILLLPKEDTFIVNIIPGHAILDVAECQSVPNYKPPDKMATHTPDDIIIKKNKLISWFRKNLLPITESEQKILLGNVSILPPYGVSNICTDNPVLAMQIRKIIESMPHDFDPNTNKNK